VGRNSCCIVISAAFGGGVATSRLLVEREIIVVGLDIVYRKVT